MLVVARVHAHEWDMETPSCVTLCTHPCRYYRLLMEEKWTTKKKHNGQQWVGPNQLEDKTGELMMLPSDIVLTQDPAFKPWVEKYAKDEDLFFKDFASAFGTLLELGVDFNAGKKA